MVGVGVGGCRVEVNILQTLVKSDLDLIQQIVPLNLGRWSTGTFISDADRFRGSS